MFPATGSATNPSHSADAEASYAEPVTNKIHTEHRRWDRGQSAADPKDDPPPLH